jgi:hypothetical protein
MVQDLHLPNVDFELDKFHTKKVDIFDPGDIVSDTL